MGLLDWFRSTPQCPLDPATREWVDGRWHWLESQFGLERLRKSPLILPRPEFFPDPYTGTADDVTRLLERVCGYMDVDPKSVELSLYNDRWKETAGLYHAEAGKFRIGIEISHLTDPLALVATMAHELGHVHLLGHGRLPVETEDHEPLTDLLTVFFGMGVITSNAVIREESWQYGQSSGWKIARQGYLDMRVYGYALALFAQSRGENQPGWSRELRPDVRSAFQKSLRYLGLSPSTPDKLPCIP